MCLARSDIPRSDLSGCVSGRTMLPPSSVVHPAAGALFCVALWFCCCALGAAASSALLACWVAAALHFKHLLGTTYRQGRLPSRSLNLCSRATFLAFLAWTVGLPCRPPQALLLSLYAYTYLDGGEWTGQRRYRHGSSATHPLAIRSAPVLSRALQRCTSSATTPPVLRPGPGPSPTAIATAQPKHPAPPRPQLIRYDDAAGACCAGTGWVPPSSGSSAARWPPSPTARR